MFIAYLQIILSFLLFASSGIFARWVDLPVPLMTFYRFLFAFLVLFLLLKFRKEKLLINQILKSKALLIMGIATTLTVILFFYASRYTTIANAVVLLNIAPILVALFAPVILKEKLEKKTIYALIISFLGIIFIASPHQLIIKTTEQIGILCGIVSGITYAIFLLSSKKIKGYSPFQSSFLQNVIGLIVLCPFLFLEPHALSISNVFLTMLMGVVNTALAFSLFLNGIKKVKVQYVGILSYSEPIFAAIYALFLFQETPTVSTILGGILIIIGGYLVIGKQ